MLSAVSLFAVCAEDVKPKSFVLVLDAGHGGHDPGAISKRGREKDINLAVTLLVGKYIAEQHPDVKIVYTRRTDVFVELNERAGIANRNNANLFISIHTNASPKSATRGAEVYVFGASQEKDKARMEENLRVAQRENSVIMLEDDYEEKYADFDPKSPELNVMYAYLQNMFIEQSMDFAATVLGELKSCVSWKDNGVRQAIFAVLRKSSMPRVLVELDYISNAEAEKFLLSKEGQQKQAQAICRAFTKFKADYDKKNQPTNLAKGTPKETNVDTVKNTENVAKALPSGSVYKVQILASSRVLAKNARELKGYAAEYYKEKNLYKYTYGATADLNEIKALRKKLQKDFKDAFIVRFENGVKVETIY